LRWSAKDRKDEMFATRTTAVNTKMADKEKGTETVFKQFDVVSVDAANMAGQRNIHEGINKKQST